MPFLCDWGLFVCLTHLTTKALLTQVLFLVTVCRFRPTATELKNMKNE